jgi:glycosyltransferase involved in cell wall biosynthesis
MQKPNDDKHIFMPKLSIVMPVWNGARYLREAIDSILQQTFTDFEFIVIDDGSTDDTVKIIRSYSDTRIRLHCLPHAGIVQALNYGYSKAQALWFARQDADDISHPRRLEQQWTRLQNNPQAILCYTHYTRFAGDSILPQAYTPRTQPLITLLACFKCPISHETYVFSRKVFERVGGYREEERHAEDFGLLGRLLEAGTFVCVNRSLLRVRIHPDSINRQEPLATQNLAHSIAVRHCQRFMNLTSSEANLFIATLQSSPQNRVWKDWLWCLRHGIGRLQRIDGEVLLWLLSQTARTLLRH